MFYFNYSIFSPIKTFGWGVLFPFLGISSTFAQQGIGTNNPNASSAWTLLVQKGVLIPSVSTDSLTFSPPIYPPAAGGTPDATHNGMVIYNTNANTLNNGLWVLDSTIGMEEPQALGID